MCYIPDNYDLWLQHDRDQTESLERLPVCDCCGERVQTEKAFYYNDQWFCDDKGCEKELMELVWEDIRNDYLFDVDV